jgi:hypothetical protein
MSLHARVRNVLFVLIFALVGPGIAAEESSMPNGSASPPVSQGIVAPASTSKRRLPAARLKLSPMLARQVSFGLPVWSPAPVEPAEKLPPPDPEVVKMAPVVVWGTRVKLSETDVLTDSGKLELAEKRYISPLYRVTFGPLSQLAGYYFNFLSIFQGWHPNEAEAVTLYRQDERLKMLSELDSLIRLETIGDAKEGKELQRIRFEASELSR